MSSARLALVTLVAVATSGPARAPAAAVRPLAHDAYVWQRSWTGAVRASVEAAPRELVGLRVLIVDGVDVPALARAARPVTVVVRIEGFALPAGVTIAPVLERVASWRAAGVDVIGVEIDHDAATSRLGEYAAWLAANRPPAPLRWSITALPTWADDGAGLAQVAAAVDEVVVQVHAVRAPRIFDDAQARRWVTRIAALLPAATLRVALPTYRVALGAAAPVEVARFVRWLERADLPTVRGVVWFRLPVDGDREAWPAATLMAVIGGQRLAPAISARLVARGPDRYDVIVTNTGTVTGPIPTLRLGGDVTGVELIITPGRELGPGITIVAGWATGKAISIDAR